MLAEVLPDAARRSGARPAVVAPDGWHLSYTDLHRLSGEVAAGLAARGLREGDLLALCLPASPDYLVAYLAAATLGAVTVGINPRAPVPERRRILGRLQPALLITDDPATAEGFPAVVVALASGPDTVLPGLREPGAAPPPLPADPDRPVAVVLTSGTTGVPKGAVFRDRELRAIAAIEVGDRQDGGGPSLVSTELVHIGAMTKLAWQLRVGSTLHLLRRWRAADALRVIATHRIPVLAAVPAQLALILRHPDLDRYDWSHLQRIVTGAGPSTPALVRACLDRFRVPYGIRYSCTESGGLGCMVDITRPDDPAITTVGRPRPGITVEVRDPATGRPLGPGEVGEVWIASPAVMAGYWADPDATAATLVDGAVRTGDLGRWTEDGLLVLVGRSDDTYIRGGYNVHPGEVEAVLADHPAVAEVAVVGRPDDVMGEVGVAVVVPRDPDRPPTLEELRAFAADRLAAYKLPEELRIVDALPLTPMHKLDRRALRRQLGVDGPGPTR